MNTMTMHGGADWSGKPPAEVEAFILETGDMLHELDGTSLHHSSTNTGMSK
ncbi:MULTISPECIES: hypothetical protein [Cryobacterium]|uniref:hypothetical protein n=1 Tax=Cryobacterium TaxID=69578 RepID=UPI00141AFCCD|nr:MULTISPECIES: hypothetical protein [Cryobacterium]